MAELKSSSRSHKTGTFRGVVWAEETIPLLPLCHVTIMCNKDKWLTLKQEKKKSATFSEATQMETALGVPALCRSASGWCHQRCCLHREKFTGQKWKRPIGVRRSPFRLPARGSTPATSLASVDTPGPAKVISDENMMKQQFISPPRSLLSISLLRVSAGTAERRRGS